MEAKLRAVWIIVECPNCHKPQVIRKWVGDGEVYNFESVRPYECDLCEQHYEVHLQVKGTPDTKAEIPYKEATNV